MDASLEDNSSLERAKQSAAWVAAYMGKDISRCSEADKLMAIEAFSTFANAIPVNTDDEGISAFERAQMALRWVSAYMGREIARCDEPDKLRALKSFGIVSSTIDGESPERSYDLAIQGVRWISNYTGKEIKFCNEEEKRAAIAAFPGMARAMGTAPSGESLNALQQQNQYDRAKMALRWIEAYAGKDIKYCTEDEKRDALSAYPLCAESMATGQLGQRLDLVEQQDMFSEAKQALSWIAEYLGKEIKHCDEEEKKGALRAYKELKGHSEDSDSIDELKERCEFLESIAEQYREEYLRASSAGQDSSSEAVAECEAENTWLREELDDMKREIARHEAAEEEISWLQAEAEKALQAEQSCIELEIANSELEARIRELEDEVSWLSAEARKPSSYDLSSYDVYADDDDDDTSYPDTDSDGMWY